MQNVPHADREELAATLIEDVGEDATRFWVGPYPRLRFADEDYAFSRFEPPDPIGGNFAIAFLQPFTFDVSKPVQVRVQFRLNGEWPVPQIGVGLGYEDPDFGNRLTPVSFWGEPIYDLPAGMWHDTTTSLFHVDEWMLPHAEAGRVFVWGSMATSAGQSVDISYLGMFAPIRPTPLQWRQRTDELGVSGVRPSRHASTYYATNRARGML